MIVASAYTFIMVSVVLIHYAVRLYSELKHTEMLMLNGSKLFLLCHTSEVNCETNVTVD